MFLAVKKYDAIFVGGGLASGLAGLRLKRSRPELSLLFLEAEAKWGGNHTWSFHQTDILPQDQVWMKSLISKEWHGHSVRFPSFTRGLSGSYFSIRSDQFDRVMKDELGASTRLNTRVAEVRKDGVVLMDGSHLYAKVVLDARGAYAPNREASGFQKFVGWEVRLKSPHGLRNPLLMDVSVEQKDGFRFVYLLPWSMDTLLVEDTRYSSSPEIDRDEFDADITAYVQSKGWEIAEVLRNEEGCLAIPLTEAELKREPNEAGSGLLRIGVRAGMYQPTTGYSLPYAVRLANRLADIRTWETSVLAEALVAFEREQISFQRFSLFLNRMLFWGAEPATRYLILQRFYGLSQELIERFYSGHTSVMDRARILLGKPPIPVKKAWACLLDPSREPHRLLGNRLLSTLLPSEVRA